MKINSIILIFIIIHILGCGTTNKKEIFVYSAKEYWSQHHATENQKIVRSEYDVYSKNSDTIIYITHYYRNGDLKSKIKMENDLLVDIEFVLDTLGNEINFGNFNNGTGYVIEYSSDYALPAYEGEYINGNKEGWWKKYHSKGYITDSTFYKEGFPQLTKHPDYGLGELLNSFPPVKNNLYE